VGGTGFYIDALIDGALLPEVPPNMELRNRIEKLSHEKLYSMLKKIDPNRAKNIDAKNKVRLIRAIEIAKAIGSTPPIKKTHPYDVLSIGIDIDQDKLKKNISVRLKDRIKKGMINEVKKLHEKGLYWRRMESLGLEYRYTARFLKHEITKSDMMAELEKEIWNYAKRQKTLFKRNKQIHWIQAHDLKSAKVLVKAFIDKN
jgi:tRNA dimethylallyltransferase